MNSSRKGDLAEIRAVAWLWDQGYEVFRNVGCTGPVDLIATKDDKVIQIDVKTVKRTGRGWCFRAKDHEKVLAKGIRLPWVHEEQVGWNRDYFDFGES